MSCILSQRKSGNACEDVDTVILSIIILRFPERELLESGVYAVQGRSGHGKEEKAVTPTNTKLGHLRGLFASYLFT